MKQYTVTKDQGEKGRSIIVKATSHSVLDSGVLVLKDSAGDTLYGFNDWSYFYVEKSRRRKNED